MVPRIRIHLSAPSISHLSLAQFGLACIAVGSLALTLYFGWVAVVLHEKIDALENQTHAIITETGQEIALAKSTGLDLSDQAIQKIPQQISFVKQVRERVGFSWTQLLTNLESAVPKGLMMSTVSLDEKTSTVLLNGSTSSLQKLNQLIHHLEKHHAFYNVILTQHAKKKKSDSTEPSYIVFSIKVSYDPIHQPTNPMKS